MNEETAAKLERTAATLCAFRTLPAEKLAASYGEGKWTAQQIISHLADAALAFHWRYLRCIAGEAPEIQMFAHDKWIDELRENERPVELSTALIDAVHRTMAWYLRTATPEQLDRYFTHPTRGNISAIKLAELTAWHAGHHISQVEAIRDGVVWTAPPRP